MPSLDKAHNRLITSTPGPSRKSIGTRNNPRQSILLSTLNRGEDCNDDDAERGSLVASERMLSTPPPSGANRDESISLTPQKEHYEGCLKLYAENKITRENAWHLHLIDYMSAMLARRDGRMSDLQTASTVVDASTRIYAARVDAVHHDVLLMAGGLTRVAHTKRGKKDDNNAEGDGAPDDDAPAPLAKKKKRMKGAIATNPELLCGDFETNLCIDPFFERLAATAGDVTSSNRSFNATLHVNDDTLALVLRTDVRFLEASKENVPEDVELTERVTVPRNTVPPFTDDDHICRPFTGFSIHNWDPDTEDTESRPPRPDEAPGADILDLSQQALAFDVHADVEPVPAAGQPHDPYEEEPPAGLESEEEGDVGVAACVARAAPPPPARLTDMRPGGARDARLEYSYCAVRAAWAGPAHWRLKHNRASHSVGAAGAEGATGAEGARRGAGRARRPLQFERAGLAWDRRAPRPGFEPAPPARITISRRTLATGASWSEANYRTPVDRGLDESFFRKLFLRRNLSLSRERAAPAPPPPEPEEARHYDYDNENDASYCPLLAQEGAEWSEAGEGAACTEGAGALHEAATQHETTDDIGDLIEPPAKIPKVFIPYATRAKKVDMKQFKQCTWKLLTEGSAGSAGEERVERTTFSRVFREVRARLGGEARDALSVPLALLAVLHLANERGLVLAARDDLADIDILGLLR